MESSRLSIDINLWKAVLLGVLGGDAALAEVENKKSAEIELILQKYGGLTLHDYIEPWKGKRRISAGHPTDDSELTAALAMSFVECQGFEPSDVFMKLRDFIHGNAGDPPKRRSYLTSGDAYGSGGTLRSALRAPTYELSLAEFAAGNVRTVPSNGALMRCAPVALAFAHKSDAIRVAREQSCVTHIHPESQVACMAYTVLLSELLSGESRTGAYAIMLGAINSYAMRQENQAMKDACSDCIHLDVERPPTEAELWPHTGGALISLRIAIWTLLTAEGYIDGLERIARLGGDTDTYGAIAGGLLGANFGLEGIPKEWREMLIGHEIMEDLAVKLYNMAYPEGACSP